MIRSSLFLPVRSYSRKVQVNVILVTGIVQVNFIIKLQIILVKGIYSTLCIIKHRVENQTKEPVLVPTLLV